MKLRNKLFLAQAPMVLALVMLGVVAATTVAKLGQHSQIILKDNYRSILAAERMKEAVERMDYGTLLIVGGHLAEGRDMAEAGRPRFESELYVQEHNITEPGEAEATALLRRRWQNYLGALDGFLRAAQGQSSADAYFQDLLPRSKDVKEQADVILTINQEAMVDKSEEVRRHSQGMEAFMLTATVLAVLAGLIASVVLLSRIIRPLTVLSQAARRIGQGDFAVRAQVGSGDEIGALAQEFNAMADGLERYRKSSLGELLRTQHTASAAMDSLPDPIVSFNLTGEVINVNQAAEQALGIGTESSPSDSLANLDPALRAAMTRARTHVLEGKGSYIPKGFEEAVRVSLGGVESYYLPLASPVYGETDNLAGVTVVLRDVGVLRKLDDMSADLVATFAHEFRTPLTSLHMAIHVCLEQLVGSLTDKQQELLLAAREECERLQAMINDLLDMARIQSGRIELAGRYVELGPLVETVIEQRRLLVEEKGLTLSGRVPKECRVAYVDPDRLALILSNLVGNAIRHTPPGGSIEIRAKAEAGAVRFEVSDTGVGISQEYQDQVFEKFFRVPGQTGGSSGLGLTIAKNIVEAWGGRIGLESQEGQGSTFWFVIPQPKIEANKPH